MQFACKYTNIFANYGIAGRRVSAAWRGAAEINIFNLLQLFEAAFSEMQVMLSGREVTFF